jgi:hypothetical protein
MLGSYRIDIHSSAGHTHESKADNDFPIVREWSVAGQRNASIHHHEIVIPENAAPGSYHFMVYCLDEAGNEAYVVRNIELSHDAEEHHHDDDDEEHDE